MLRVQRLRVDRGDHEVVRGVDLHVDAGEAVAIIGSNGAGKTTLLRAVCGLQPVRAGKVAYRGTSLVGVPAHRVARLGVAFVPAERHLFPEMTVADNLALGAYPQRPAPERFERVFALFPRLAERRRQRAGTLSGGEQQMLAVGRALMADPSLLVLDEPTTGLAPVVAAETYHALERLRAETGVAVLVAEQQVPLALAFADRACVLEGGCVVLRGSAAELADDPQVRRAYLGVT